MTVITVIIVIGTLAVASPIILIVLFFFFIFFVLSSTCIEHTIRGVVAVALILVLMLVHLGPFRARVRRHGNRRR